MFCGKNEERMTGTIVLGERSERCSFSSSTKLTGENEKEIEDESENDDEDDDEDEIPKAEVSGTDH